MIVYVCCKRYAATLGTQLHLFPGALANRVRFVPYEVLYRLEALPAATYVFTDFDRLDGAQFRQVCRLWDWLDDYGGHLRLLNDPRKVLQRFSLLRALHAQGLNDFNVYRLQDWRDVRRFPVFLRRERGHSGNESPLIGTEDDLEDYVRRYAKDPNVDDMMIVEFGTAAFPDGRYRKFGAFRVGDVSYLQHCFITSDWYSKSVPAELSDADVAEANGYRAAEPDAQAVLRAFEIAHIDYGRADYTVVDGRVQVFEINTNPTTISNPKVRTRRVDSAKFADLHETAMLTLDSPLGPSLPLPDNLRYGPSLSLEQAHEFAMRPVRRRARLKRVTVALKRALKLGST